MRCDTEFDPERTEGGMSRADELRELEEGRTADGGATIAILGGGAALGYLAYQNSHEIRKRVDPAVAKMKKFLNVNRKSALPAGWEERTDGDGRTYYESGTGEVQWEVPTAPAVAPPQSTRATPGAGAGGTVAWVQRQGAFAEALERALRALELEGTTRQVTGESELGKIRAALRAVKTTFEGLVKRLPTATTPAQQKQKPALYTSLDALRAQLQAVYTDVVAKEPRGVKITNACVTALDEYIACVGWNFDKKGPSVFGRIYNRVRGPTAPPAVTAPPPPPAPTYPQAGPGRGPGASGAPAPVNARGQPNGTRAPAASSAPLAIEGNKKVFSGTAMEMFRSKAAALKAKTAGRMKLSDVSALTTSLKEQMNFLQERMSTNGEDQSSKITVLFFKSLDTMVARCVVAAHPTLASGKQMQALSSLKKSVDDTQYAFKLFETSLLGKKYDKEPCSIQIRRDLPRCLAAVEALIANFDTASPGGDIAPAPALGLRNAAQLPPTWEDVKSKISIVGLARTTLYNLMIQKSDDKQKDAFFVEMAPVIAHCNAVGRLRKAGSSITAAQLELKTALDRADKAFKALMTRGMEYVGEPAYQTLRDELPACAALLDAFIASGGAPAAGAADLSKSRAHLASMQTVLDAW